MPRTNRRISNRYIRHILQAIDEEMGRQSLPMVLRNAGLERYIGQFPPPDSRTTTYASELASLQQAIRVYYGRGARGSLTRIGRGIWRRIVAEASWLDKMRLSWARLRRSQASRESALRVLLAEISEPEGQLSFSQEGSQLTLIDQTSDFSYNQQDDEPTCWITQGMIAECLSWVSGLDHEVDEIACQAWGAEACRFTVNLSAGD